MSKQRFSLSHMLKVSSITLVSRVLGFVRELLLIRYFGGARALSDAFVTAMRIPNLVYELCVSGALGPAVFPTLAYELKTYGRERVNRLMTLLMFVLGIGTLCISALIGLYAATVIRWAAPGFLTEQAQLATQLLRILISSLVFTTITALIAEALRTVRHFVIPASGQVIVNCVAISGLILYHFFALSLPCLALIMVAGAACSTIVHSATYSAYNFELARPDHHAWKSLQAISRRILPVMISVGILHFNSFIELQFASYLAIGSVSLLTYSSNFTNLPLGIFSHACTTVIFPDFVRIAHYARQRLGFIMYETAKLMTWILLPIVASFIFFSYDIFNTLYGITYFSPAQLVTAQWLLIIKALAICFLALNQILLYLFHALQETAVPGTVSLISLLCSVFLNSIVVPQYGIYGIACTSTAVACIRTLALLFIAERKISLARYFPRFAHFGTRALLQLMCIGAPLGLVTMSLRKALMLRGTTLSVWFSQSMGLWLWVAPLWLLGAFLLYATRHTFGIKLYLIDRTTGHRQRRDA